MKFSEFTEYLTRGSTVFIDKGYNGGAIYCDGRYFYYKAWGVNDKVDYDPERISDFANAEIVSIGPCLDTNNDARPCFHVKLKYLTVQDLIRSQVDAGFKGNFIIYDNYIEIKEEDVSVVKECQVLRFIISDDFYCHIFIDRVNG